MSWHSLVFEANSIQAWVFGSGRLRHIVGGSRIISGLTSELLDAVLDGLGLEPERDVQFSRRAGGAFYAFSRQPEALAQLAECWPVFVERYAPGLSFSMGAGEGDSAMAAFSSARADLQQQGQRPWPSLPQATPLMERAPRTGRAAVARRGKDLLDAVSLSQAKAEQHARSQKAEGIDPGAVLAGLLDLHPDVWPRDMEPDVDREGVFPYRVDAQGNPSSRYVALIHADGNGLGQVLRLLHDQDTDSETYLKRMRDFSDALDAATWAAAVTACREHLLSDPDTWEDFETLPARPVILGGDDLTFIVRADLALPFTRSFLKAFEKETAKRLSACGVPGLKSGLTACAGLAYLRSNQPFYMGVELAESLCAHAKQQVRAEVGNAPMFSALSFYRCTDSVLSRFGDLLEGSLSVFDGDGTQYRLTMETWALDDSSEALPPLDALVGLLTWLNEPHIARGPGRQLLGLMGLSPDLARTRYRRWLEIVKKRGEVSGRRYDQELAGLLGQCAGQRHLHPELPFIQRSGSIYGTPLGDALALKALDCQSGNAGPARTQEVC